MARVPGVVPGVVPRDGAPGVCARRRSMLRASQPGFFIDGGRICGDRWDKTTKGIKRADSRREKKEEEEREEVGGESIDRYGGRCLRDSGVKKAEGEETKAVVQSLPPSPSL